MIKNQVYGTAPVTTRYSTFTGGFGLIACGVGVIAVFLSFVPAIVPIGLDILAALFFLGGGIVCTLSPPCPPLPAQPLLPFPPFSPFSPSPTNTHPLTTHNTTKQINNPNHQAWAYGLRNTDNCTNPKEMLFSNLLNRGHVSTSDGDAWGVYHKGDSGDDTYNRLRGICRQGQAGQILQFISFGIATGLVVLAYFQGKRGGGGGGRYVA